MQVRSRFGALLLTALVLLLSVSLAAPANAADAAPQKPLPAGGPTHKYGLPYYPNLQEFNDWASKNNKLPVSKLVDPTAGLPSSPKNPAPLVGKIVQPGDKMYIPEVTQSKGPVKGPAAGLKPSFKIPGAIGLIGFGIGGTSQAPVNAYDLGISNGVGAACAESFTSQGVGISSAGCTSDEATKMMAINSCAINNNCEAIGAKAPDGSFFGQTVLPFLKDMWAKLTGQLADGEPVPGQYHYTINPRGCYLNMSFTPAGAMGGSYSYTVNPANAKPTDATGAALYNNACGNTNSLSGRSGVAASAITTCVDTSGNTARSDGASYGRYLNITNTINFPSGSFSPSGGWCAQGMNTVNAQPVKLVAVQFMNELTQSTHDAQASRSGSSTWGVVGPQSFEWLNPDPNVNTVESTEVTTTVNCKTGNGTNFTYSTKVKATAGFADPTCPKGSSLVNYDVSSGGPGLQKRPIAADGIDAGALAKYPGNEGGAPLDVYVDGQKCVVGKAECETWPQVQAKTPSRVKCGWGSHWADVDNCRVLADAYKTETGVVMDPNSGVWTPVDANGSPVTALNPQPYNPTNPNPTPGVAPGTSTGTTPGTGTGTGTGGFPTEGTMPADAPVNANCSPKWAWNPFDWVGKQLNCAFVPQKDVKVRIDAMGLTLTDKGPFVWLNAPFEGPSNGGCPDWEIHLPGLDRNVVCDSSFTAAIVAARGGMFTIIMTAMVWPLVRSLWYASIPFLKATASK